MSISTKNLSLTFATSKDSFDTRVLTPRNSVLFAISTSQIIASTKTAVQPGAYGVRTMKKKQKNRFAKNDTWPFVLRSVRHLHSRVATQKVCPDLCQKWKWCSLRAEALCAEAYDISDTSSDAGTDTDSYYYPSSVDEDPKDCEICRMHVGGKTTYKMVTLGASAGNLCCVTILDAIDTWTKNSFRKIGSKSLLDLEVEHANIELLSLPWNDDVFSLTTAAFTPIIQLRWETMSDQTRDTDSVQLIIFQPTGTKGKTTSYPRRNGMKKSG